MISGIKYRTKERQLCFTPADAHEFGTKLHERFPDIRFRKFNYGELQHPRDKSQCPRLEVPVFQSLGDATEDWFRVSIEPEGWKPVFGEVNEYGGRPVTNKPVLHFVFERAWFIPPPDGDNLRPGRIWARFLADDKEHERFLGAVWRISAKLSTNVLDVLDPRTGQVKYKAQRTMIWAGYHALDWCRADPARRLDENLRPAD